MFTICNSFLNPSFAGNFRENHKQFCNKYVGKQITIQGNITKITSEFCDVVFLKFAPEFEKKFAPLLATLSNEFSKYKTKKFQIEDFVYKKIDNGQLSCGNSNIYSNKHQFLKDFDYKINCKMDDKLNLPFELNTQLLFDENRFFNAVDVSALAGSSMMGPEIGSMLLRNTSASNFFIDLMNSALLTLETENTFPQVQLINDMISIRLIKRFDIKNLQKTSRSNGWIGYVISMMDYALFSGSERRKKMIFPYNTIYSNKDECYRKFKILFSKEPLLSMYPQSSDPKSSYIYGCVEN